MLTRRDKVQEYEVQKTAIGLTQTAEGEIPHRSVALGDYIFLAPVKLHTWYGKQSHGLRSPVKDAQGRYLFALPGGGESALA